MIKLIVTFDIKQDEVFTSDRNLVVAVDMLKKSLRLKDLEEYVTNLLEDTFHGEVSDVRLDIL